MRAATASGYVFVGSAQHRRGQTEVYHAKVAKYDKADAELRQAFRRAIALKDKFWEEELALWEGAQDE